MEAVMDADLAGELRMLYPKVLGKTLRLAGGLADAEDAVQDAIERALESWPSTGRPESGEAWLVRVAANCLRDRHRRARREARHGGAIETLSRMSPWVQGAIAKVEVARGWKDDLLRLLFACCCPTLDPGESAALALATILGLSTAEIAQAFVVAPRSMDQRLTRARRRLRDAGDYEPPRSDRAADRLGAVLATVYLLFNEGYWSTGDEAPIRAELCRLAPGLGRSLRDAFPVEPEVLGLLALMTLHEARRPARMGAEGTPLPLPGQDRTLWDREAMAEGAALVESALGMGSPGPFQIEAAISAIHGRAARAAETDWQEIAELYAHLERLRPAPSVRVNRAFAVARARGPRAGLALLDERGPGGVEAYPYVHLVRGSLLEELGDREGAAAALERAEAHARNTHERYQIRDRLMRLRGEDGT
ncbi:MAG: RNA polymerase sigma factor [Polyangiaceae bacterium]